MSNKQPWVAVATPTRGLIFTEVIEYVESMRSTYPNIRHFLSHDLPIPDCFNTITEQILQDEKYEYIFYIEEDTVPPIQALDHLLEAMKDYDIAAIDYAFNSGSNTIVRNINGDILFTGFGCTLIKREVLMAFEKPIFRADRAYNIGMLQWYPVDSSKVYGMYDIIFGSEARKKGFRTTQVDGECTHLELQQLGAKEINNGCHVIGTKGRIIPEKKLVLNIKSL